MHGMGGGQEEALIQRHIGTYSPANTNQSEVDKSRELRAVL